MERISTSNRRLDTWKEIGAFFGRDERTVKRWESYVNGHGGINGHPVKVIDKNDNNDPAASSAIVHAFVTNNHVIAILDGSGQDAAWASFVRRYFTHPPRLGHSPQSP